MDTDTEKMRSYTLLVGIFVSSFGAVLTIHTILTALSITYHPLLPSWPLMLIISPLIILLGLFIIFDPLLFE